MSTLYQVWYMLIRSPEVLPVRVTLAGNTAWLTTRMWVNVTQQLSTVNHVDLEVQLSYRVPTSAGPKEEGLLATRAYVGVNAHIATREVWRRGVSAASPLCNDSHLPVPYSASCVATSTYYSWLRAIWHHMCHDFDRTSAGDSQLTWSNDQSSLMNLI